MDFRKFFLLFLIITAGTVFAGDFDWSAEKGSSNPYTVVNNEDEIIPESTPASDRPEESSVVPETAAGSKGGTIPQPGAEPSFRLSETDSSLLFFQRLNWEEGRYAVRYTIILERIRESTGAYAEVLRRTVDAPDTHLDVSVPAGDYRFRILSYNILGRLDSESDWEYFSVIQALQPSIVTFEPGAFYFDRFTPRIITIIGENLLPEAEIFLLSQSALNDNGEPVIISPREIHRNELGENARLIFNEEDLVAGKYDIVVKNPGGLETRTGVFTIAVAKPYDINVSAGYTPMLTLSGQKEHFLDKVFIPLSFSARVSFMPLKWNIGNFGVESNVGWSFLTSDQDGFKTEVNLVMFTTGALYQHWIIKKELSVNGRLGVGFAGLFNYRFKYDTGKYGEPINVGAASLLLGGSVQWQFFRQFFFEGGLDFVQVIHQEVPISFVRLGLFFGYQF